MNDHTNDNLRDLLDSAAPDQPQLTPGERAGVVTARAHRVTRRNRFVLAAAVLAVVGAGVAVPLAVGGGEDPKGGTIQIADGNTEPSAVEPEPCPTQAFDGQSIVEVDALPGGAAWARLCPASFNGQVGTELPSGVVTDGVEDLVTALGNLPAVDALEDDCALMSVMPDPWAVVIGYDQGTPVVVGSTARVCSLVTIGGTSHRTEDVLLTVTDAIPAEPATAACPDPIDGLRSLSPDPDTTDQAYLEFVPTEGVLCYGVDPMGGREYRQDSGTLSAEELANLYASIGRDLTAEPSIDGMCADSGPTRLLVLVNAEGERLTLTDSTCTGEFESATLGGYWQPSEVDEKTITKALGGRAND